MKFFCASCKQRHEVSEIGAAMLSLCRGLISKNLDNWKGLGKEGGSEILESFRKYNTELTGDAIDQLLGELKIFVEGRIDWREFIINGKELAESLNVNPVEGKDSCFYLGDYKLSFEKILKLFLKANPNNRLYDKLKEAIKNDKSLDADKVLSEMSDDLVCSMRIGVRLKSIDGVYMLEEITDENCMPLIMTFAQSSDNDDDEPHSYRVCAHKNDEGRICGRAIPPIIGHAEEIVIGLLGSPRAGKTSCLTAMASSLYGDNAEVFKEFDMRININNEAADIYSTALLKEIKQYRSNVAIEKTPIDKQRIPTYSMLLELPDKGRVITFVDMPGEFWETVDLEERKAFFKLYAPIYTAVDCAWLLISKIRVTQPRLEDDEERAKKVLDTIGEGKTSFDTSKLVDSLQGLSNAISAIDAEKTMPPTIVIMSKTDSVCLDDDGVDDSNSYNLFPKGKTTEQVSGENIEKDAKGIRIDIDERNMIELKAVLGKMKGTAPNKKAELEINEREFFARGDFVRDFIETKNKALGDAIKKYFPDRFYVGMAAYGCTAKPLQKQSEGMMQPMSYNNRPHPYHELFPLIWTLAITDSVAVKHTTKILKKRCKNPFNWGSVKYGAVTSYVDRSFVKPTDDKKGLSFDEQVKDSIHKNLFMKSAYYCATKERK